MLPVGACFGRSRNTVFLNLLNIFLVRNYTVRVRFAPSPTGYLHLGGLRTALYNFLFCRKHGGKYILRIEDTDQTRLIDGTTEHLIRMLKWTGVEFDEGPHVGGEYGPYVQSQRLNIYERYCKQLLEQGHAYRCFCTPERLELIRKHAALRGEVPRYDNRCRHLKEDEVEKKMSENKSFVVRLKLRSEPWPWHDLVYGPLQHTLSEGDVIIMKSDGYPTYHFANVIDDHLMEITHVLRGVEWQVSTVKHLMLYQAFGWGPPKFAHLPLLQNRDGKKLSKRQKDVHVDHYKTSGFFPESVLNLVTNTGAGFEACDTSGMSLSQLIDNFNLSKLHTNSTKVDFDKIFHFNKQHIKLKFKSNNSKLSLLDQLRQLVKEHFQETLSDGQSMEGLSDEYLSGILDWSQDRISLLSDLLKPEYSFLWMKKQTKVDPSSSYIDENDEKLLLDVINNVTPRDPSFSDDFTLESISSHLKKVCDRNQTVKYGHLMKLLRTALCGPKEGPSVAEMMAMLGKKRTLERLNAFIQG